MHAVVGGRIQLSALYCPCCPNLPLVAPSYISVCCAAQADADPTNRKLFVRGLAWETTSEQLLEKFKEVQ